MKHEVKTGQTDYSVIVFIPDSASTDGSGKTGLLAANLTVSGVRVETDNDVTVTDYTGSLTNLPLLTTAHTDWGLLEVSSTLAPGLYRLDIADAIFATGAWSAVVYVMVTTSAAAASPMEFVLIPQAPVDGVLLAPTTHTSAVIPTVTTVTNQLTAAQVATGVWQDATAGDFTTASSIGKSLYTSGVVPGGTNGLFIAGTNAATTVTTALTTTFTGNLTGSVGSVTGAVGSVTAISAGAIIYTSFGADAIDAAALAPDAGSEIADRLLARSAAGGSDGTRPVKNAIKRLVNRTGVAAGTLTVYESDDVSAAWTAAITTADGNPVSDLNPA